MINLIALIAILLGMYLAAILGYYQFGYVPDFSDLTWLCVMAIIITLILARFDDE